MVRCADCGFLALKNIFTGQFDEADENYRGSGEVERRRKPGVTHGKSMWDFYEYPYDDAPVCFAREWPLSTEVRHIEDDPADELDPESIVEVLREDRRCEGFIRWQQGFAPKDHREMQLRQEEQRFQEERLQVDRKWREEQDERQRQWQRSMATTRLRWEIVIFGVVVTLILALATIAGALIERGIWLP